MNMLTTFYLHFTVVIEKDVGYNTQSDLASLIEKWKDQRNK